MRPPDPPLLLITDRRQARGALSDVVAAALHAGCRWVSVREKDLPPAEQIALARVIETLAAPFGAQVTLHGDPALAVEAGLDGVHLPAGADVAAARRLLGPDRWLGVSTHGTDEIEAAAAGGADAVTLSPIFESASKPGHGPALGLEALAEIASRSPLPVIALGGIDARRSRACLDAGAAGVAVMGEIMRASDPEAATRRLVEVSLSASSRVSAQRTS